MAGLIRSNEQRKLPRFDAAENAMAGPDRKCFGNVRRLYFVCGLGGKRPVVAAVERGAVWSGLVWSGLLGAWH